MPQPEDTLPSDNFSSVVLAIIGHRHLKDPASIANSIGAVIGNLSANQLSLLSPLAEGADRLAALEILRVPRGILHAILPLPADDYETDFTTPESLNEFHRLLAAAADILVLPPQPSRPEAYLAVGCHLVNSCDILLAVWDELPAGGIGGTADVVAYARANDKPLIIINSDDPSRIVRECFP